MKQGHNIISVQDIARGRSRPFYLYDIQGIRSRYRLFLKATDHRVKVFFAMKANFNRKILKALRKEGCGLDVVSRGEAHRAFSVGFSPQKLVFSGVGKSRPELKEAVQKSFFQINAESFQELNRLAELCGQLNRTCQVGLRINPNMDFKSHPYIKTGLKGHKFGFEEEEIPQALAFIQSHRRLVLRGLSMHLGSQIFDLAPLFGAIRHLKNLYQELKKNLPSLARVDVGGGLAVNYQRADFEEEERLKHFGRALLNLFKNFDGSIMAEPGRLLVARFGLLCARIEYIKEKRGKHIVILNSGMNHFLRTALYGAKHRILPLVPSRAPRQIYDIVGPICENSDIFARRLALPGLKPGEWLALADAGAYGSVMSSDYNLQARPAEVCFDKGQKI